jgi:hypothetical protein
MEVKKIVKIAKDHILDLFSDENISNLGLEEVEFDEPKNEWKVIIGFSRPWDEPKNTFVAISQALLPRRTYKIVKLSNDDGRVISVKAYETKREAQ